MSEKLNKLLKASKNTCIEDEQSVEKIISAFLKDNSYKSLCDSIPPEVRAIKRDLLLVPADDYAVPMERLSEASLYRVLPLLFESFDVRMFADMKERYYRDTYNCTEVGIIPHDYYEVLFMICYLALILEDSFDINPKARGFGMVSVDAFFNYYASIRKDADFEVLKKGMYGSICEHLDFKYDSKTTIKDVLHVVTRGIRSDKYLYRAKNNKECTYFTEEGEDLVVALKILLVDSYTLAYPEKTAVSEAKQLREEKIMK